MRSVSLTREQLSIPYAEREAVLAKELLGYQRFHQGEHASDPGVTDADIRLRWMRMSDAERGRYAAVDTPQNDQSVICDDERDPKLSRKRNRK